MDYAQALWLYTLLVFGIIAVPGMDMAYVIANAITGGRQMGMAAIAGIMLGGAIHTLFGALAVGAFTQLPALVFQSMILIGAAYMAWIGFTLLRSAISVDAIGSASLRTRSSAFCQGTITCLLNPKAYLFVLAVFPQFMRPGFGPLWSQALVLATITLLMQALIYGALALAAGRSRDALIGNPTATIWIGRSVGALFLLAALIAAWHGITMTAFT
ncbi:threonine transporter RhtB [Devosia soli]|uniref:Threonine transporter RhtB n=1 Tax=Devosia soli TaxID=361041 RepID=A0A0F5LBP4_9HYPH|nr:LysE family translocator [Devosia soli]KKB79768.1 threonine transporter RhtB [Devosia soli]